MQTMATIAKPISSNSVRPHRPSGKPWMRMVWRDLLFMHWPVDYGQLSRLLPPGVRLDTYDGRAWISVVPFRMTGVSLCGCPDLPWMSKFPELNIRTYVTDGKRPGVWFFSLDATNWLAVRLARRLFYLPYMDAKIQFRQSGDWIHYRSQRKHRGEADASLAVEYRPLGSTRIAEPGSLEDWLTNRYWMYLHDRRGQWYTGAVDHAPWQLRDAQVIFHQNRMLDWLGFDVRKQSPLTQFARATEVVAWLPEKMA
jgi:hypothetical protein